MERHLRQNRRKIYVTGVAKHSKVLTRYRLAMMLERVLVTNYPAYVEIPRDLELKVYKWSEYAKGNDLGGRGRRGQQVWRQNVFCEIRFRPARPSMAY